ncbi:NAD(P)/FAD-dependent oxidoreductase [Phaeovulum vinaykumarii]|uniref:3-phenylpropionate/trans-cinnamate dioxygenase ferredoxin reductase subunit n=1 Tax=Phaeovulum vinaykumarii TaxID=407234 RepID=A0A1N7K7R2_9RHOB|nr:FAD-dependent oxidoreductase [Phaeovulum vinaykumarii]SIS57600.1 3-phenylpropionate/trans-cinnamate dioxygenase ferredoxin reductase subunit [Phaeovulum vinaykumarii]SOB93476.1 3-phenylpropionate/trans-cinnamate dioxygenase ferredoxin reductase subunit [Phaeovulum vinaykumarii]
MSGIVIVGAGQAAASAAARLRTGGFDGPITLVGDEPVPPYQRPPLSKGYLLGEMSLERMLLRPEAFWAEAGVRLRLGTPAAAIDRDQRRLRLADGETIPYRTLILATGAAPRRIPAEKNGDLAGVYTVRRLADVTAMTPEFRPGARLVVVGGGYVGLEAAAVARKLGLHVVLVEAAPRILGRVASEATADALRMLHQGQGVQLIEGMGLERLEGADGRVSAVRLADGRLLPCDFVIAGIGAEPVTALAEAAGLSVSNGIVVDEYGGTSDPAIWAAGDCAAFPLGERRIRLESVGNAVDMGDLVAANILGAGQPYMPKPWFWSDQYDAKLQIAGLGQGADTHVLRPGPSGQSVWCFRGRELLAVEALNDPRAYMIGRRLIEAGRHPAPAAIADTATDLKELLA